MWANIFTKVKKKVDISIQLQLIQTALFQEGSWKIRTIKNKQAKPANQPIKQIINKIRGHGLNFKNK